MLGGHVPLAHPRSMKIHGKQCPPIKCGSAGRGNSQWHCPPFSEQVLRRIWPDRKLMHCRVGVLAHHERRIAGEYAHPTRSRNCVWTADSLSPEYRGDGDEDPLSLRR